MRLVRLAPTELDAQAFADYPGVALEARSDQGERIGAAAARVMGTEAAIRSGQWVTGAPEVLEPLLGELIAALRREFGVREVRASAPTDDLYRLYTERLGMVDWLELLTYERPPMQQARELRSPARIRLFAPRDQGAVTAIVGSEDGFRNLRGLAERFRSRFAVAELEGRVVGYAFSYIEGDHGVFKSLEVAPGCRRAGIGWDLTCDALRWFDHLGLPSRLRTGAENVAARTLYERLGYRLIGRVRMVHRVWTPECS